MPSKSAATDNRKQSVPSPALSSPAEFPILGPDEQDDIPLSFDSPESESIVRAEYDPSTETMTVEFRRAVSGKVYQCTAFPAPLWREFSSAESKGKFFATRIRPIFPLRPLPVIGGGR